MRIVVCIKQVPASNKVKVDPDTGVIIRNGAQSKTNPYDLYAVETALRIKEQVGGTVTAISMGPSQAEEMMRDVFNMGVDEGVLVSDRAFAGSDVLATSYTLSEAVKEIGGCDLIICGKQTTDGDTAQIGPALAEHLSIPHISWVSGILDVNDKSISVSRESEEIVQSARMEFPCLITVESGIFVPRLPSYKRKKAAAGKTVRMLTLRDFADQNKENYGLSGSPTNVEKIFTPEAEIRQVYLEGQTEEKMKQLVEILQKKKLVEGRRA
ncbi:electron transfer flavoprotein subunit beta [Clostridium sp. MCC353]|uniref:electron transfer flavoprotein subunit beta/FixA family protein n=1 Tax=Clostridium sp. MCC353 TaxID=2592646 RepID=UPI001C0398DF|nr:electron transfer flavoprotein subunit beta/FixA family protein [Clostridium sp. MCC353]MBT9779534.1 electron transfer flavoprotein subunit beta [Clostridium sp. MCC353]